MGYQLRCVLLILLMIKRSEIDEQNQSYLIIYLTNKVPQDSGRARNFLKSQSLRGGSGVEFFQVPRPIYRENILTYFFKFFHIFDILLHILHIIIPSYFLHIPSYFLHIPTYFDIFLHIYFIKEFPNVTSSRKGRVVGGCTRKYWNYTLGPDLEIFLSPSDIFSNVTSSGGWRGCTRKSWYYLAGHKTWNMWKFVLIPLYVGRVPVRRGVAAACHVDQQFGTRSMILGRKKILP